MPLEIQIQKPAGSAPTGPVTIKLTGSLDTATALVQKFNFLFQKLRGDFKLVLAAQAVEHQLLGAAREDFRAQ